MTYDYDLIVIGAGSGGVRAARISAGHGAKVAVIEGDRPGGTCVIRGCVPKKLLMYAAAFSADAEDASGFGWDIGVEGHSWANLMAAKNSELDRLEGIYRSLLQNAGAELIEGFATVTGPNRVTVNCQELTAERILIAVGGTPRLLNVPGMAEHAITSNEALELETFPKEIVIFGSGYIALEFAGIFNGLGAKTHLVYRSNLPLRGFDADIRSEVAIALEGRGVILHPEKTISSIAGSVDEKQISFSDGTVITADQVMAATGRSPNTAGLGLTEVSVAMGRRGEVIVDENSRTSVPSIFAVGDVTDRISLTPVAIAEGHAFADRTYGGINRVASHENVASAVFSQPPVASIGLNEADADKKYDAITVFESRFRALKNAISGRDEKNYLKMVVETASDRVVGVHMMGPDSGEIMQGIAIAIKMGATKADFDATIGIHPTAAEEFVTMRSPRL